MAKLYRVEVVKSKDEFYPHQYIQMLYTYDGYFLGSLCGRTLLDVEVVPPEFLATGKGWHSKFKGYIRKSNGGSVDDSLFNRDGTLDHSKIRG